MRTPFLLLFVFLPVVLVAQQGFTFTHFATEDGLGLSSNAVTALHQDEKGFIWVGTANGLQRFDGSKFVHFGISNGDPMPFSEVSQIIPYEKNQLLLNFGALHQLGIFSSTNFFYKRIDIRTTRPLSPQADFYAWKDSRGEIYLNVFRYGILRLDKKQNAFVDDPLLVFPAGYSPSPDGIFEDVAKQQVWFACNKGLCIYDRNSRQMWWRNFNPRQLPILKNELVQDRPSEIFIDKWRRIWVFGWPQSLGGGQVKFCLDSTGSTYLRKDTVGLNSGPKGYAEYHDFLDTKHSGLWIYGMGALFNWDENSQRFHYTKSVDGSTNNSIDYDVIYDLLEDRDGNIWLATDRGLYFTSYGSGTYAVINYLFDESKVKNNITDVMEMPDGELWFTSWERGVVALDAQFREKEIAVYRQGPPDGWPALQKSSVRLTWSLTYEKKSGKVWVGCNHGVLLKYDPLAKKTEYLLPAETGGSTIRYLVEDAQGQIWLGTQSGKIIKWDGRRFTVVYDIGTIIYKLFFDRQGTLWVATQERGLLQLDPATGRLLHEYTAGNGANSLYSNTGQDIEQLNDSIIVYGAGALNFINRKRHTVKLVRMEDGLPSNSVRRLRMDGDGFLWIITANGLSRFNPFNGRITTYGRQDGITLAGKTVYADFRSSTNYIVFAGGNALMMFKPSLFVTSKAPPDVAITDFKVFNTFIPVDSLMQLPKVTLQADLNSFGIYFSSLSYQQRDRLAYYFKMEGIDKEWQVADRIFFQNYSLLPPGDYVFKVYAENVEGIRSLNTTELPITIKPPFYRTKWFISTIIFLLLLFIYFLHRERVNKLLAVEKIRNRVARDLHDDMGSTLSTINILSAMAKSKMNSDPVKTAGYISKISDNSQRMMEAMDDIVWSIKPSNDTMQRVTARMREFATNVLEAKDILLHFVVEEDVFDVRLNMEARRDFFLVFKEALNNAAKYSRATEVWVSVAMYNRQLSFAIKDNGVGFDVAKADGGNGLGNMQKRADNMNGKLRVKSVEGEGTEVWLVVPVM
jgi:ligand-binding sensor domain-containing protein/two-component sensor histidine kinase